MVRAELLEHFVDSRLTLMAVDQLITPENIATLLPSGVNEVVLLCVDNHETRKLISDYCEGRGGFPGVDDICLISGGNDGVGADSSGTVRRGSYGNVQVYIRRDGTDVSPSLTAFHKEIDQPAKPSDRRRTLHGSSRFRTAVAVHQFDDRFGDLQHFLALLVRRRCITANWVSTSSTPGCDRWASPLRAPLGTLRKLTTILQRPEIIGGNTGTKQSEAPLANPDANGNLIGQPQSHHRSSRSG